MAMSNTNSGAQTGQVTKPPLYPEHIVVGSLDDGKTYSDEAITGLYSSILSMISTESQLVWSRYNVMLAANSFIGVLLGAIFAKANWTIADPLVILGAGLLGLALSWQWKELTSRGWELEHYWVKYAESFKWNGYENPLEPYQRWCHETGRGEGLADWISVYAHRVIWLFISGYCVAIVIGIATLFFQVRHLWS